MAQSQRKDLPERDETYRRCVGQALEAALVVRHEVAAVDLVRELQQPVVQSVFADDWDCEEPAQRLMLTR